MASSQSQIEKSNTPTIVGIEVHPAASLFPLMADADLRALADDISRCGQQEPCVLYQGRLLDGRNRWRACELLGIEPETIERDDEAEFDPVAFVLSHNLHRRHLSESQRATVAARLKKMLEPEAKERKSKGQQSGGRGRKKNLAVNLPASNGDTRDQAAALLNVSGKSVDYANRVLAEGSPELIEAVESGEIAVSRAAKVARTVAKSEQLTAAVDFNPPPMAEREWGAGDSLADVQADIEEANGRCRELSRFMRTIFAVDGNEITRPFCGCYSLVSVSHPLLQVGRTLMNDRPVGGTAKKPVLFHEEKAKSLANEA